MRTTMKIIAVLMLWFFGPIISAQADSLPVYDETGSFSIIGNNVCGGPCVETVYFSFRYSYTLGVDSFNMPSYIGQIISGGFLTSAGPLGSMDGGGINLDFSEGGSPFIPFGDRFGDELDILVNAIFPVDGTRFPLPPLTFDAGRWFICNTVCGTDYINASGDVNVIENITINQVPEPGVTVLLGIGLGFGLLGCLLKRG